MELDASLAALMNKHHNQPFKMEDLGCEKDLCPTQPATSNSETKGLEAQLSALQPEHEQDDNRDDVHNHLEEMKVELIKKHDDKISTLDREHHVKMAVKLDGQSSGPVDAEEDEETDNNMKIGGGKEDVTGGNERGDGGCSDNINMAQGDSEGFEKETRLSERSASGTDLHRLSAPSSAGCGARGRRSFQCSVSLRQWLSNPGRVIDRVEGLHICRQVAEFVELAHSQGVVLGNIRPSSFLLSPLTRVSIIDSASTHTSSGSSEQSTGRATVPASLADRSKRADRLRGQVDPPNIAEHSLMRQQEEERVLEIRPDLEVAQQSEFGIRGQSSRMLSTLHTENQTEDSLQIGGTSGIKAQLLRTASRSSLADDTTSSGSQTTGDRRIQTTSSGEKRYAGGKKTLRSGAAQHCSSDENLKPLDEKFPLKQMLVMEQTWYKSPEELTGRMPDFSSDVYSLGILFFELFCSFGSEVEWSRAMADLRHRLLPPRLLLEHPKEAAFCLWLLHPDPSSRPKAREVLYADLFSEVGDKLAEREAVINLEEKESETEITLGFLLRMQQQKQEIIQKLSHDLACITADIDEVERWQSLLKQSGVWSERLKDMVPKSDIKMKVANADEQRPVVLGKQQHYVQDESHGETRSRDNWQGKRKELLLTKTAQLMRNFNNFKQIYSSMKRKVNHFGTDFSNDTFRCGDQGHGDQGQGTGGLKLGASRLGGSLIEQKPEQINSRDRLGCFFDSLGKYFRYTRFEVKATLQHGDLLNTANMVCSLSFDQDEELFATAGVCKKIKVFEYDGLLKESVDIHYPVIEMTSRTRLSSICWNNFTKSHLASSDYEGAVQLWDVSMGRTVTEFKEHMMRAWSVDFSQADPLKLASGSDDCCVKLWSMNQAASVGTIKTRANVCCVQFPPDSSHLLVFGSADYKVYCYDLRITRMPIFVLTSHSKAVSFVRFVDSVNVISASTDNTLKLWDLTKASTSAGAKSSITGARNACTMTFTGHTNEKNFVGLSVAEGGYIACGSETNEVFAYHKSLPMTMMSHKFGNADPISGQEVEDDGSQFVSSVCWRRKSQTLVAANSIGNIKVLEMV